MIGAFTDARGKIEDLFEESDLAITKIYSLAGAIRGNHYHKQTHQWTYIVKGETLVATDNNRGIAIAGDFIYHPPGTKHAFRILADSEWLVITKGPRNCESYEEDTFRLEVPLFF